MVAITFYCLRLAAVVIDSVFRFLVLLAQRSKQEKVLAYEELENHHAELF